MTVRAQTPACGISLRSSAWVRIILCGRNVPLTLARMRFIFPAPVWVTKILALTQVCKSHLGTVGGSRPMSEVTESGPGSAAPQIVECVPNFSEGVDAAKVHEIMRAMCVDGVHLLDYSLDSDHNRSVVTIAGLPEAVVESAVRGAGKAAQII